MNAALLSNPFWTVAESLVPTDSPSLADYGIAGVVASIFLAGIVWIGRSYINELKGQRDQQKARADRLEGELKALADTAEDRIDAARTQSTEALNKGYEALLATLNAAQRRGDR